MPVFSRTLTEYGERTPLSVQVRENTNQNNSEYGHFLRSVWLIELIKPVESPRSFVSFYFCEKLRQKQEEYPRNELKMAVMLPPKLGILKW